jgi:hypothetical protein
MSDNYNQATVSPNLPSSLFSEDELESLAKCCGLQHDRIDDLLYFYAEEFCELGEDEFGNLTSCVQMLQSKLKQLDAVTFPNVMIEGAETCSPMNADQLGGFAFFITRQEIRFVSTSQWLQDQKQQTM